MIVLGVFLAVKKGFMDNLLCLHYVQGLKMKIRRELRHLNGESLFVIQFSQVSLYCLKPSKNLF
jgi:hypothetical protein